MYEEKSGEVERFPDLSVRQAASHVGRKFAALCAVSDLVPVPRAVVVPTTEFQAALSEESRARVQALLDDLRATMGAFFTDTTRQLEQAAAEVRMGQRSRRLLSQRLRSYFPQADCGRFAVRSSGLNEDTAGTSMAGVYQTFLDVSGLDAILSAVEQCWRSYYAPPAVAARTRAGDYSAIPQFAVMIQEFVPADMAGVAFSGLDGDPEEVLIEYLYGNADSLVAGQAVPKRAISASADLSSATDGLVISEVTSLVRSLQSFYNCDVDVEWAANSHGVKVLQVRPVTARRNNSARTSPKFWIRRLYFDPPPDEFSLGAIAKVYASFEAKRGPLNRKALAQGIDVTHGWIAGFGAGAIRDAGVRARFSQALSVSHCDTCLVDLGDNLRQIVMLKDDVPDFTRRMYGGASHESGEQHALLVRDYLRGDLGIVTHREGGELIVEYSQDGLMALNRGTAGARRLVVSADGRPIETSLSSIDMHIEKISALTRLAEEMYGDVALEWVLEGDRLVFLDYSVLGRKQTVFVAGADLVISAGTASGPVLNVRDSDYLRRLSVGPAISIGQAHPIDTDHSMLTAIIERIRACPMPPIVRVSRPYAVLSVLIGLVSGFVFDEGSTLCHLAILLREAGVPAVCAHGVIDIPDGTHGVISLGTFWIAPR